MDNANNHSKKKKISEQIEKVNCKLYSLEAVRLAMIEAIPDALLMVNHEGIITYVNHQLELIFGYTQEELIGEKMEILIPEPYRAKHSIYREHYFKNPHTRPMGLGMDLVAQHKNGSIFSVEISLSPLNTSEGKFVIAIIRDISKRVLQTKELQKHEEALQKANKILENDKRSLQEINTKIILITEFSETLIACSNENEIIDAVHSYVGEILNFSRGALYLYDYSHDEYQLKTSWGELKNSFKLQFNSQECWGVRQGSLHEKNLFHPGVQCKHLADFKSNTAYLCVPIIARSDIYGLITLEIDEVNFQSSMVKVLVKMISKTIAIAIANVNLQELLKDEALHDTLTGLYNRRFFDDYLNRQIHHAQREGQEFGLLLFDIDNFKQVNDTYGHEIGDTILQQLGVLLKKIIRVEDIVCRYGGEEFICVLSNSSLNFTKTRGEELRYAISNLFPGPIPPKITISLGISNYPNHGTTPSELIAAADEAMYLAKKTGKNRLAVFNGSDKQK